MGARFVEKMEIGQNDQKDNISNIKFVYYYFIGL